MFIHFDDTSQYVFDEHKYWKFTKDQYDVFVLKEKESGPYRIEPLLISLDKNAKMMSRVYFDGWKDFVPFIGVS